MQQLDDLKVIVASVIAALQTDAATIAGNAAADATQKAALDAATKELADDAVEIQSLHDQLAAALAANTPPAA